MKAYRNEAQTIKQGIPANLFILFLLGASFVGFVFGVGFKDNGGLSFIKINQSSSSASLPANLNYSSVEEVYDQLRSSYNGDLDEEKLLEGMKAGLAQATGDPYTVYLSSKQAKEFDESLNGEFQGIGAEIAIKNDQLQVVAPLADTPAEKAGLRAGDAILAIDGKDTQNMTVEEAVSRIRGESGTKVKLMILRTDKPEEITIIRGNISVKDATGKILDGNIGYIELRTFGEDSAAEVDKIAQGFKQKGVKKVILDLRNNSGGLLDQAVDIASVWLDGQVVVTEKSKTGGEDKTLRASKDGILEGTQLVVLVNGGSASASEIVAGALKDHGVATLVGEKTYGKGSVQALEELSSGGVLKVTVAKWFTPNGTNITKSGIKPDQVIELTDKDFDKNLDPQLDTAKKILK